MLAAQRVAVGARPAAFSAEWAEARSAAGVEGARESQGKPALKAHWTSGRDFCHCRRPVSSVPRSGQRGCSAWPTARSAPVRGAEAKTPACQLPVETDVPLSRRSCPELAAGLTARGITDTISASTVRRWLHQDALKPWQYRSWIFIRDPDFRAKAQRVLALCARTGVCQSNGVTRVVGVAGGLRKDGRRR